MDDPADLGVVDAGEALRSRALSSRELVGSCLARIRERDGAHSHEGDPGSVNAWVRVYEEDAFEAASRADERLAAGGAPELCGIPIGLKDLYAVAGKPLTASSRVLDEVPDRDCDAWASLSAAGMVPPHANSCVCRWPSRTIPAEERLAHASQSRSGTSSRTRLDAVSGFPATA